MNIVGVELMPMREPAWSPCRTRSAYLPESRHALNGSASRPRSTACFFSASSCSARWFANRRSWYSQYLPWSPAQCAASDALNASGWIDVSGKSFQTNRTRSP
jgi:hypothetical protein